MSKATKRKHVTKEALGEYYEPEDNEKIVKVVGGRGNNLHEVQDADGKAFLVSMPTKFRKNVWIKRGDFVIVNPIDEGEKVCAEIVYILYSKQIKHLKDEKMWPEEFRSAADKLSSEDKPAIDNSGDSQDDDDDGMEPLARNPNHHAPLCYEECDDSSDED